MIGDGTAALLCVQVKSISVLLCSSLISSERDTEK
jgi:hypothetical protein